jgi:cell division protein FtsN
MRRVRPDVSHRIRRQPSIFSVRWFRIALGVGVALAVALLVGPSVASWFGGDLPRSLFLLAPWGGAHKSAQARAPEPELKPSRPSLSTATAPQRDTAKASPTPTQKAPDPSQTPGAGAPAKAPASVPTGSPLAPLPSRATASAAPAASTPPDAAKAPVSRESTRPASAQPVVASAPATADGLAAPPSVYWVQAGAFLDHKNAERLVERLKGDGLPATTTSFEQSRVLYRVLLASADGGRPGDDVVSRVRGMGHPVEATPDGPAVTGLVPLRKAVETSHALRQQGVPVRLKQEVSSSTFRVVRVGSFPTVAEADAALATLTAKGVEGVVVRER